MGNPISTVSPILDIFAPDPKKRSDLPEDAILTPQQEEDARNKAALEEKERRKKGAVARNVTGPHGVLVPDSNVGKPTLLGQ